MHTDVGNSAVGCKINGRIAPLISTLRNGDEVLITRSASRTPPAAWDSVVVTGRARAAIRRATREAAKAQYGGLGRQIVERAFERAGRKFSDAKLKSALPRLARASIDDVFIGVGRGELYSADVVRAIYPDFQEERKAGPAISPSESGWFGLAKAANLVFRVPGQGEDGADAAAARRRLGHAGAIRAQGRRGAGRAHRRHPHAGRGDHDLSHPFARAGRLRRQAGAMARRALGPRQRQEGALSDADRGHDAQRAGRARQSSRPRSARPAPISTTSSSTRPGRISARCGSTWKSRDIQHLNAVLAQLRGKSVVSKVERLSGLMPLYFAYGANMDVAAMARALPALEAARARPADAPSARGHARGLADRRRATRARRVHGVLWDLALADVAALDRFEEVGDGLYAKVMQPVVTAGGAEARAGLFRRQCGAGPGERRLHRLRDRRGAALAVARRGPRRAGVFGSRRRGQPRRRGRADSAKSAAEIRDAVGSQVRRAKSATRLSFPPFWSALLC